MNQAKQNWLRFEPGPNEEIVIWEFEESTGVLVYSSDRKHIKAVSIKLFKDVISEEINLDSKNNFWNEFDIEPITIYRFEDDPVRILKLFLQKIGDVLCLFVCTSKAVFYCDLSEFEMDHQKFESKNTSPLRIFYSLDHPERSGESIEFAWKRHSTFFLKV